MTSDPIAEFGPCDIETLQAVGTNRWYAPGSTICRVGDQPSAVLLVESGFVRTESSGSRHAERPRLATVGAVLGVRAVLSGLPRSTTLRAITDVVIRHVSAESFHRCLRNDASLQSAVAAALVEPDPGSSRAAVELAAAEPRPHLRPSADLSPGFDFPQVSASQLRGAIHVQYLPSSNGTLMSDLIERSA